MTGKPMMEGKVAVVTGAGGGIGREIALMMALAGAKVLVNDLGVSVSGDGGSKTPAEQTKAIIEQRGGQAAISTESGRLSLISCSKSACPSSRPWAWAV